MPEDNKEQAPYNLANPHDQQPEAMAPAVQMPRAEANPELALIGQEISGCVILEKVSSGGMGTVFKAKHKALDRIVCVKVLSPSLANDKKAVGLFLTEARAIAEIDHPNIVFVYNVGREKGFYFIVMSFIEGESLSSIVRKKPNLPISFIVETFIGILRGLEAAHQKGIIHRDIKPSNILINKKLEPKIVDFGIAKKVDKDKGCTKTTELAGTAYFLSPEQALGRAIDTRADLYSVGASLFYVLTGKYPFTGKNSMDIIQKHINEPVPDVSQYRRGIPLWLSAGVAKLMSKDPKDRFQTATETLIYFQKMRADDQLKVSQDGVNIAEEVGFKISNIDMSASPRSGENGAREHRPNRFNMPMQEKTTSNGRNSIPIMTLGHNGDIPPQSKNGKSKRKAEKSVTEDFKEMRRKQFGVGGNSQAKNFIESNSFFLKSIVFTILSAAMLITAAVLFLKLGTICSGYDIAGKSIAQSLLIPWTSNGDFLEGQMVYGAIGFIFLAFTICMMFFRYISKITFIVLIIAAWSYIVGLFGLAGQGDVGWLAYTYLPVYAFFLAALAVKIDEEDSFLLPYRLLAAALLALAYFAVFNFFKPLNFEQGELTASLFYSAIGLVTATCVLPFLRGSFIFRYAIFVLFFFGCASIWVYQASGNVYYTMNEIRQYAPAAAAKEALPGQQSPGYMLDDYSPTQYNGADGYYDDYNNTPETAASAADLAAPQAAPKEEEQPKKPVLSPEEKREELINTILENYAALSPEDIEREVWRFSLKEPFDRFKYTYKQEGVIFFSIVALILYGIFMFIISMIARREDPWNLI
jgi:serine/threonine protein kinase